LLLTARFRVGVRIDVYIPQSELIHRVIVLRIEAAFRHLWPEAAGFSSLPEPPGSRASIA